MDGFFWFFFYFAVGFKWEVEEKKKEKQCKNHFRSISAGFQFWLQGYIIHPDQYKNHGMKEMLIRDQENFRQLSVFVV